MYYIEQLRNWKKLKKERRNDIIVALIRNGLFMLLGILLYVFMKNTGLLIYIILMIKYHWMSES